MASCPSLVETNCFFACLPSVGRRTGFCYLTVGRAFSGMDMGFRPRCVCVGRPYQIRSILEFQGMGRIFFTHARPCRQINVFSFSVAVTTCCAQTSVVIAKKIGGDSALRRAAISSCFFLHIRYHLWAGTCTLYCVQSRVAVFRRRVPTCLRPLS